MITVSLSSPRRRRASKRLLLSTGPGSTFLITGEETPTNRISRFHTWLCAFSLIEMQSRFGDPEPMCRLCPQGLHLPPAQCHRPPNTLASCVANEAQLSSRFPYPGSSSTFSKFPPGAGAVVAGSPGVLASSLSLEKHVSYSSLHLLSLCIISVPTIQAPFPVVTQPPPWCPCLRALLHHLWCQSS